MMENKLNKKIMYVYGFCEKRNKKHNSITFFNNFNVEIYLSFFLMSFIIGWVLKQPVSQQENIIDLHNAYRYN